MKRDSQRLIELIRVARGEKPAELLLRNCRLVNVLTGKVEEADLAVSNGLFVGRGPYDARRVLDLEGKYVCPGFIDGHIHIESTLLSPSRFCAAVVPWGTSAVVADPHEIANVLGLKGIRYFLDATEALPLDVYLNLPSCVPATHLETSGAQLRAADLYSLLPHPRLLGLAEMMNFPGVLTGLPEVVDKLILFQDRVMDGHCPRLGGRDLNAYLATGIGSDHECTDLEEAREKLAGGMTVMIREGSQSKDLAALLPLVDEFTWPHCMLVSDDRHPDDLCRDGHMNFSVNRAMELGMDPVRAITLATWTPARYFGLQRRGAVAPGYLADFSVSPTLNPWRPELVFKGGVEAARDGKLTIAEGLWASTVTPPPAPMRISRIEEQDLAVPVRPGRLRVIGAREGTLLTEEILIAPRVVDGKVVADPDRDVLKLVVFNRYVPDRSPSVAFVRGFGLKKGALAATVAHDAHNVIAAGIGDEDIVHVVSAVREAGGGMAVGRAGEPVDLLPLPVAGLMSDQPLEHVVHRLDSMKHRARQWGCSMDNPFMALSFLALPVIPALKLTDLGLVDVNAFSFLPLFKGN
ncbi:MAG: adenine deaminase [Syntrophobacteraceae bacterium]|nr:adenine deaminase [Syntrophobacteraceae bacterium]